MLVFLCFSLGGWSQDLIIYKDGRRITCRVTGIDSANIYCRITGSRVTGIPLSDIHKYYLSRRSAARLAKGLPPGISRDRENLFLFGGAAASSLPMSDYASMDVNSAASGLAMRGWAFNGLVMFKLKDYLGVKLMYRSVNHAFNTAPLCAALGATYPGISFHCSAGKWRMNGLAGGLSIRVPIPLVEGLRLNLDGDVGMPRCHFPDIEYTGTVAFFSGTVQQSAPPVNTAAWTGGVGLSYRVLDQLAVGVFAEYVTASPEFLISVYSNNTLADRVKYRQKISAVNLGIGLYIIPSEKKSRE